jgi:hypothetical protein
MVSQMEKLREEIRKVVSKHMKAHGGALLAEGRKRKAPHAVAPRKASKKHHMTHHLSGHALLAEGMRKPSRKPTKKHHMTRHMSGHAMLAEGRKPSRKAHSVKRRAPAHANNALARINHLARQLKKEDPYLDHRTAISHASEMYRNGH